MSDEKALKLFISQPMGNRSAEEIERERDLILHHVSRVLADSEVREIPSFFSDKAPDTVDGALFDLGRSIKLMAEADIIFFAPGWQKARGCKIEHACALQYDKQIFQDTFEWPMELFDDEYERGYFNGNS